MTGLLASNLALLVVLGLRFRTIPALDSPDCQFYRAMAAGKRAPAPYAYRVLVPLIGRLIPLRVVATAGIVATVELVYLLALSLGCSPWVAAAAGAIVVLTDSLVGLWTLFPYLVDSWGYAFALAACVLDDPIPIMLCLVLAALTKESAWVLGSAAVLLTGGIPWLPLPGLAVLVLVRLIVQPAETTDETLTNPFISAWEAKDKVWFSYPENLSALKLTPLMACWVLPGTPSAAPVAALAALAWAQTLIAQDHARLIAVASLWAVPLTLALCEPHEVALWVLAQAFWPFKTHWV